jgi:hypothetical protein
VRLHFPQASVQIPQGQGPLNFPGGCIANRPGWDGLGSFPTHVIAIWSPPSLLNTICHNPVHCRGNNLKLSA